MLLYQSFLSCFLRKNSLIAETTNLSIDRLDQTGIRQICYPQSL